LLVDGILCSAYAKPTEFLALKVDDATVHKLCHWATVPLRAYWQVLLRFGFAPKIPLGTGSCVNKLKWVFGLVQKPWRPGGAHVFFVSIATYSIGDFK
jgi:hypothetical protein